ncbi:MAG: YeeE/YedE family protein [Candidatus Pelagadaptatus aseana]|uniref:YeeE/YedE family protein n=1 Tax=Candidatus Pelagadaptatus aseana TaxID=3120508 RepID=UPI0039B2271C
MEALAEYFPLGISHYVIGGIMIGMAVGMLYISNGVMAGMSSVYSTTLSFCSRLPFFQQDNFVQSRGWRLVYALGLVLGGFIWFVVSGAEHAMTEVPLWQLAAGGFLAGFGARLGNGCTSGHGICGVASLKLDSLLAVLTFLTVAIITAQLVSALSGTGGAT